jgi:hypothetical protein
MKSARRRKLIPAFLVPVWVLSFLGITWGEGARISSRRKINWEERSKAITRQLTGDLEGLTRVGTVNISLTLSRIRDQSAERETCRMLRVSQKGRSPRRGPQCGHPQQNGDEPLRVILCKVSRNLGQGLQTRSRLAR